MVFYRSTWLPNVKSSSSSSQTVCELEHLNFAFETSSLGFTTCFLPQAIPNLSRSAARDARLRSIDAYRSRAYASRPIRSQAFIVKCTQADEGANSSGLEGEIREMYERSLRETPIDKKELQESSRRVLDGITETGAAKMNEIVSDMKDDLREIQEESAKRASKMIEEETDLLLDKYEQKRLDILDQVKSDRQVIKEELTRLEGLAVALEKEKSRGGKPVTEKLLLASAMTFTVASLFYAWNGFVNFDASALSNATVDAAVAAAAGYIASRRRT
ncbi:hypothetical protein FGB62_16g135 [Gracilaria domingensis]|nr:hypothetical protein FGB62_16g135 [Gracilaria domingensis]